MGILSRLDPTCSERNWTWGSAVTQSLDTCPALFYGYYCMPETPIGQTAVIQCPFYTLRLVEEGKHAKITSKKFFASQMLKQ